MIFHAYRASYGLARAAVFACVLLAAMCGTASAWWDASWNEREQITITGTRDDTDCIAELIINMSDYSDKIRSDGYDIRFVNETTNTTIDAHDFSFNQTGNSTYYIRTNITTSGTEIYMYYNNSAASSYFDASPIYTTMDRFNRGDSGSVGNAEIGGTWTEVETCNITSNELLLDGIGNGGAAYAYIVNTSVSSYSGGITQMRNPSSSVNDETRFYVNGAGNNQQACVVIRNGNFWYGSSGNFYTAFSPALVANDGQNYTVSIQHNNAASFSVWIDGVKKVTDSSYYADVSWQGYFVPCTVQGTGDGVSYFDDAAKFNKTDFGVTIVVGSPPDADPIISNKYPTTPISKYVNSSNFEINATINEITDNKWEMNNGTGYIFKEWDNSTTSPAYTFSPSSEGIGDYDVRLTAYNTSTGKDANTTWSVTVSYAWGRTLISQFDMCLCYYAGNLLCGDIDNDGSDECLAVGRDANQLVILETGGTNRTYNVQDPSLVYWTSLKDIDEDGQNEIVYTYGTSTESEMDLYQFNSTDMNQSSTNNILGVASDNPHGIGWMEINDDWRFYTSYCGGGEVTHTEINFTGFDYWQIDTVANSGEDTEVFDIDQDGVDELVVAGGFAGGSARVYIYEINNATGAYTAKTTVLSSSLDASTHYSAYLTHGDIDNDGIENLIVLWEPQPYTNPIDGIIEAYEFNTSYASGYEEGFEIASTGTGFLENGDTRTYVVDVDGDGDNELLTGQAGYIPSHRQVHLSYYDVGTDGADITKHILYNFTDHFGSAYYTWTVPAMINDGGIMKVACMVINETHSEFYLFERAGVFGQIVLYADEYALINNWTSAQNFSQIDANISNLVCASWYNYTSGLWEGYRSGRTYNADAEVSENCSAFVFVDAQTTISAAVHTGGVTIQNATWFYGMLPGSTAKTYTEIETAMNVDGLDVWALWVWNSATQAYTTTGSYSVAPNEGYAVYVNTTGEYTP